MEEDFDEATMDACLIAAGQRAEHYEMAAYGTLVAWARAMGHDEPPTSCRELSTRRRRLTRSCLVSRKPASIRRRPTPLIRKRTRNQRRPAPGSRKRPRKPSLLAAE